MPSQPTILKNLRLALYAFAAVSQTSGWPVIIPVTLTIIPVGVFILWLVDILLGRTLWLATGWFQTFVIVTVIAVQFFFTHFADRLFHDVVAQSASALILLLLAAADTFGQPLLLKRLVWLLWVSTVGTWILFWYLQTNTTSWADFRFPVFAAAATTLPWWWKACENADAPMHASLDYGPVRIELFAEGMKKLRAIGIKRNRQADANW